MTSGKLVLGNTTKTASADRSAARLRRFALQSEARRQSDHENRVQDCLRKPVGGGNGRVAIKYRPKEDRAFYVGLVTCGQLWRCPVCAAKITERRRQLWYQYIAQPTVTITTSPSGAILRKIAPTYSLAMATFTLRHTERESLSIVLNKLTSAYDKVWSGRWAKDWKLSGRVIGTVRALEVTHGGAGWHPHIHTVFVCDGDGLRYATKWHENTLKQRWIASLEKVGGYASFASGCRLHIADSAMFDYINKLGEYVEFQKQDYGAVTEVTKYPTKKGREGNATVHGLLGDSFEGSAGAGALWREAQGELFGRRHISTSAGLLRKLGASQEMTDDKLAATELQEHGDKLLALLEAHEWKVIIDRQLQGLLLNVAEHGNALEVSDFLVEVGAWTTGAEISRHEP